MITDRIASSLPVRAIGLARSSQRVCLQPRVSLLVRVKNEIGALPFFWKALEEQTFFNQAEIIFLDSGSTDGTQEFLSNKSCKLYSLEGAFNFGRSCNQIAALASAPVFVFLSGHVVLKQNDALEQIVELLEQHPNGAACLRQVPNTFLGCSSYEAAYLAWRFPAGKTTVRLTKPLVFSNAASAITRRAWQRQPFVDIHGSEDFIWAEQHLRLGGELFYLPQLQVMHSHNETPEQVYQRVRLNVEARSQTGNYWKSAYVFTGVYLSMRRIGSPHSEAFRYACAHAKAYR